MLVIALRDPHLYINAAGLNASDVAYYGRNILFTAIALLALFVFGTAYLLIDDYIAVKASKGAKRTIFARIKAFFKDYKSEVKKIVWPGPREVVKNTIIVLLVCLVIGLFVWLLDMGLGRLLKWILGISTRR
ncbi:MAG: preprotein translocase subunit SecE [Clostridia bacterium]|nr:preprotein translocase subunit SecE [Clostridia bacterium]